MKATNFDIRISRELAEYLLKYTDIESSGVSIMCKEYGQESRGMDENDDDWTGLCSDDLDENGHLDDDYQTIELFTLKEWKPEEWQG